MKKSERERLLALALGGELDETGKARFEALLSSDEIFRAEWERMRQVGDLVSETRAERFDPFFSTRVMARLRGERSEAGSFADAPDARLPPLGPGHPCRGCFPGGPELARPRPDVRGVLLPRDHFRRAAGFGGNRRNHGDVTVSSGTRSAAILIATLVIGMVLGALGFGAYQRHRFRDALSLARPAHFTAGIRRAIAPIDETRRAEIAAVLRRIDERMRANRIARNQERRAQLDSVKSALEPLLTEDQRRRLRRHLERHKRMVRRGAGRHHGGKRH